MRAVYNRSLMDKNGKAACTVTLGPLLDHHLEDLAPPNQGQNRHGAHHTVRYERQGNVVDITIGTPGAGDHDSSPPVIKGGDVATVCNDLLSGVVSGLGKGPRRNALVRRTYVSVKFDPETDFFGTASSSGHIINAARQAVRQALQDAAAAQGSSRSDGGGGGQRLLGVLEPFVHVRIHCPEAVASAVRHDFAARGGRVLEIRTPEDRMSGGSAELPSAQFAAADMEEDGQLTAPVPTTGTATVPAATEDGRADASSSSGSRHFELSSVYAPPDPYESQLPEADGRRREARDRMLDLFGRAPFREMMEYDQTLRSLTAGRHTISMREGSHEVMTPAQEKALEVKWRL